VNSVNLDPLETFLVPSDNSGNSIMDQAATEAWAGVREPSIEGIVEIAEWKKTVRMISDSVFQFANFVKSVKNGSAYAKYLKKNPAGSISGFMAQNWLKYRYGVMPMVMTAQAALKLAREAERPPRFTARGEASLSDSSSDVWLTTDGSYATVVINRERKYKVTARAGVLYDWSASKLLDELGLNGRSIPSALWELIPFSFIADWFLNYWGLC
jgi:hypothetical protein